MKLQARVANYPFYNFYLSIKMSGSESQGHEEAACMHVFRPTRPLLWVIYMDDQSKFLKCCCSATITAIAWFITDLSLLAA